MVLNFGGRAGRRPLWELNLPAGAYWELWNSTWPAFAVEGEDEHGNGGCEARLRADPSLHVPDYGVVVLERVGRAAGRDSTGNFACEPRRRGRTAA